MPLLVSLQSRGACAEQALQDGGRLLPKCFCVKDDIPWTRESRIGGIFGWYQRIYCYCLDGLPRWRNEFASPVSKAQWNIFRAAVAQCLYKPNAPAAPLAFAPTLCNRSPTFLFASKNLATHRSMQTLSPLLRSPSVYRVLIHLAWHVLK
jgi:hypothetical protein